MSLIIRLLQYGAAKLDGLGLLDDPYVQRAHQGRTEDLGVQVILILHFSQGTALDDKTFKYCN